jgi:hypothetical protein
VTFAGDELTLRCRRRVLWDATDLDHLRRVAPKASLDDVEQMRDFTAEVRLRLAFPGHADEVYRRALDLTRPR